MPSAKVNPVDLETSRPTTASLYADKTRSVLSLRGVLILFVGSVVLLVVVASVVPTAVFWFSSLSTVSNAATGTIESNLATYRASVVNGVVYRMVSMLETPYVVAQLISQSFHPESHFLNLPLYSGVDEYHKVFLPLQSTKWPNFASTQIGYQDQWGCQHLFRRLTYTPAFGIWDQCNDTVMHFYKYNGTTPTTIPHTQMNFPSLTGRPWYDRALNPAIAVNNTAWAPPFFSVTPGEGKLVSISIKFGSPPLVGVAMVSLALESLNSYMSTLKHSPNGWGILVEGPKLNIVASTVSAYVSNKTAFVSALTCDFPAVRRVTGAWLNASMPSTMTILDEEGNSLFIDVQPLAVVGGGVSFNLFLITPRKDFTQQVEEANAKADNSARKTLVIVVVVEIVVLIGALALSILVAVLMTKPLRTVTSNLARVAHLDFGHLKTERSSIMEISKLQAEAERMGTALSSFGKYVPTVVVKHLLRQQISAEVGVKTTTASLLFLDVVDFTKTMDTRGAPLTIKVVGDMFETFSGIIIANAGIIDKYIGDCIMAFWGVPEPIDSPVVKATSAVDGIVNSLGDMEDGIFKSYDLALRVRIGVHHGVVHAGNVGCSNRLNYTVLGGTVNLASRLESLNKEFGTVVLVSDEVRNEAGEGFIWRCVGLSLIRGFATPIRVHELVGRSDRLLPEKLFQLQKYSHLDKQFMNTGEVERMDLEEYCRDNASDIPANKYLRMLQAMEHLQHRK